MWDFHNDFLYMPNFVAVMCIPLLLLLLLVISFICVKFFILHFSPDMYHLFHCCFLLSLNFNFLSILCFFLVGLFAYIIYNFSELVDNLYPNSSYVSFGNFSRDFFSYGSWLCYYYLFSFFSNHYSCFMVQIGRGRGWNWYSLYSPVGFFFLLQSSVIKSLIKFSQAIHLHLLSVAKKQSFYITSFLCSSLYLLSLSFTLFYLWYCQALKFGIK